MADPSRPPTFSQYGVERRCYCCGERLTSTSPRWFVGYPIRAVYCLKPDCAKAAAGAS